MINDLLNHSDAIVRRAALRIDELTKLKNAGELSDGEYNELCKDVLAFENIEQSMDDLSDRQAIVAAVEKLSKFAGIVSKVV